MKKIGVCIVTYNEEKYIAQAIDSVLNQQCTASVVCYVGNDCSTDQTGYICRQYAENNPQQVVFIDNQKNLGLVGNTKLVLEHIVADKCDYVAMLDGDDYWVDPLKLQKQLDFLDQHLDYGFVHTNQLLLYNDKDFVKEARTNVREGDIFEWAGASETAVANCTAFFRTELLQYCNLNDFLTYGFKSVDYTMYIIFMRYTKFHFMDDFTAVWRRGHLSVSGGGDLNKQIQYLENGIQQWKYLSTLFPEKYPYSEANGNKFRARGAMKLAYQHGNFQVAHTSAQGFSPSNRVERLQQICARNIVLFKILYYLHYRK